MRLVEKNDLLQGDEYQRFHIFHEIFLTCMEVFSMDDKKIDQTITTRIAIINLARIHSMQ